MMPSHSYHKLSLSSCTFLLIGCMIGSAIFSLSGLTLLQAGPAAAISWFLAAVIMLFYGLCMAELSCRFPQTGGVFIFPRRVFPGETGRLLGWLSCWSCLITNCVAIAFSAIYIGLYLSVSFPFAATLQIPLALGSIFLCLLLNISRIDLAARINIAIVALLLITLCIYVATAFFGGHYDASTLTPFFSQGLDKRLGVLKAIPTAIIGYGGIVALTNMADDVKSPQKNIPRSMLISLIGVTAIYVLVILSTAGLVNVSYLKENPDKQFIPLFAACFTKLQSTPWISKVVSVSAVLALITTMLVCVSINARIMLAASNDNILPAWLGKLNKNGIPVPATILSCIPPMFYGCFPSLTQQIVNFGTLFNVLTMLISMLAVIKAKQMPHTSQVQFHAPGGIFLPIALLLLLLSFHVISILNSTAPFWLYTAGFLALGYVIYLFRR